MDPIEVQLQSSQLDDALNSVAQAGLLHKLTPKLAVELLSQTEANFRAEGRPKWPMLSKRTIAQREKTGSWPGKILQRSGKLARDIVTDSGPDFAQVGVAGSQHPYAAIQQFGGKAGRDKKVEIPARPYLPMDAEGNLQPQAEEGLLDVTYAWLNMQIGK